MTLVSVPFLFDLDVNVGRRILGCVSVLDSCLYLGSRGRWIQKDGKETAMTRSGTRQESLRGGGIGKRTKSRIVERKCFYHSPRYFIETF